MKKLYISFSILCFWSIPSIERHSIIEYANHVLNGSLLAGIMQMGWLTTVLPDHAENSVNYYEQISSLSRLFYPTGIGFGILGSVSSYIYSQNKKKLSVSEKQSLKTHVIVTYSAAVATTIVNQMMNDQKLEYNAIDSVYNTAISAGIYSGLFHFMKFLIKKNQIEKR